MWLVNQLLDIDIYLFIFNLQLNLHYSYKTVKTFYELHIYTLHTTNLQYATCRLKEYNKRTARSSRDPEIRTGKKGRRLEAKLFIRLGIFLNVQGRTTRRPKFMLFSWLWNFPSPTTNHPSPTALATIIPIPPSILLIVSLGCLLNLLWPRTSSPFTYYCSTRQVQSPYSVYTCSLKAEQLFAENKADLRCWCHFLPRCNGVSLIKASPWIKDPLYRRMVFFNGQLPNCQTPFASSVLDCFRHCINSLELPSIMVALKMWGASLQDQRLVLLCDNDKSVIAVTSGRSCSPGMQLCLREIWFFSPLVILNSLRSTFLATPTR